MWVCLRAPIVRLLSREEDATILGSPPYFDDTHAMEVSDKPVDVLDAWC